MSENPKLTGSIDVFGLVKLIVGVLTPAAIFYAAGYVITQAYVVTTGLQASFWFTESFYREAGARFVLDTVQSIALLPHLFIPVSALFIATFPGNVRVLERYRYILLRGRHKIAGGVIRGEATFLIAVLVAVAALVVVLKDCGEQECATILGARWIEWLFPSAWLFGDGQTKWLLQKPRLYPMAIFLALAIPTAVALGLWAYRLICMCHEASGAQAAPSQGRAGDAHPKTPHPLIAFLITAMFVVVTFYIPIAYGVYFYDFVVVELIQKDQCTAGAQRDKSSAGGKSERAHSAPTGSAELKCYLLGHFDTRYILIGREPRPSPPVKGDELGLQTSQRIYIWQVTHLEPFAIDSTKGEPLRPITDLNPVTRTSLAAETKSNEGPKK